MDLHYKIHADSDHVAKFQGDRSRELGERVAKKKEKRKKHHEHFISLPATTVNGRPNKWRWWGGDESYRRDYSPSQLAWSDGWRPLGGVPHLSNE